MSGCRVGSAVVNGLPLLWRGELVSAAVFELDAGVSYPIKEESAPTAMLSRHCGNRKWTDAAHAVKLSYGFGLHIAADATDLGRKKPARANSPLVFHLFRQTGRIASRPTPTPIRLFCAFPACA